MMRFALTFLIVMLGSEALAGAPQPPQAPSISAAELHDSRSSGQAPVVIVRPFDMFDSSGDRSNCVGDHVEYIAPVPFRQRPDVRDDVRQVRNTPDVRPNQFRV